MRKLFKGNESPAKDDTKKIEPDILEEKPTESKLADPNLARNKMFKKGVSFMADERMEEAVQAFEEALQIDPGHVDSLLKLGYSRFHIVDFAGAMNSYDNVLEIDVTNADAWN